MSFLRVVGYDISGMTDDQFAVWDDTIGAHLRSHPECIRAKAARGAEKVLVVSEWTSEDGFRTDEDSEDFQAVLQEVVARLALPADLAPDFLFEGDVVVDVG